MKNIKRQYNILHRVLDTEYPLEWEVRRLREKFSFRKGLSITKENLSEEGIPVINYGQIHAKNNSMVGLADNNFSYINESYIKSDSSALVTLGDFIFADTSEDINGCGNCCYVDREGYIFAGYHSIIMHPKNSIDNKYFAYLFMSAVWRRQIHRMVHGVKVYSITQQILKDAVVLIPPRDEQDQIVRYLDWKTAAIDRLIAVKQKQIDLLEEYRIASIDRLVRHGDNPDTMMKPSCIKWLGDIPAHWHVGKVKQYFSIRKEIAGKEGYTVLSITQQGIKIKDISSNEGQMAMSYENYQLVRPGDFAMNHMDLLTGYIGISDCAGVTSPDYRVFILDDTERCNPRYYLYVFQLGYKRKIFYGLGRGAANKGRWRLPASHFKDYDIPIPPREEQDGIVAWIEKRTAQVDAGISKLEEQIKCLKELKSTLISDVVTGKIDVRDAVIPTNPSME